jgi:carbon storage regulator
LENTTLGEAVQVGDDVRVVVMDVRGKQVRIGIEAPASVRLFREEVPDEEREQYRVRAIAEEDGDA